MSLSISALLLPTGKMEMVANMGLHVIGLADTSYFITITLSGIIRQDRKTFPHLSWRHL